MEGKCVLHGLNRYKTLCEIGEGAFGVVFKCKDLITNEVVALKEFKTLFSDENENLYSTKNSVKRKHMAITHNKILREIATLRRLHGQKNIIQLKDFFLHENRYYLSLEYFPQTLLQYLEKFPKGLPIEVIKICIYQLLIALEKCHSMGIIHRDVKPENILIKEGGADSDIDLKLCDFGFARFINQNKSHPNQMTEASSKKSTDNIYTSNRPLTSYVSTRWYRAPELLVKSTEYGSGIDLWAVGCIMAELIDGEPLFPGTSDVDQLYLIRNSIGRLDDRLQEILESDKKFYEEYKRHICNGFLSGSNSRYNLDQNKSSGVIPPYRIMSLRERYGRKIDSESLDLLEQLLTINPLMRPNCKVLLLHPFFLSVTQLENPTCESSFSSLEVNEMDHTSYKSPVQNQMKDFDLKPYQTNNRTEETDPSSRSLDGSHNRTYVCVSNDEKTTAPSTPDDIATPVSYKSIINISKTCHDKISIPKFPHLMPPPPPPKKYR
ncbi:cyclin-dependent kinase family 5 protein [Cryptosporidium felis]|nr:cyclin-dependent kinase family 5 protein [Cryptosporidium felis]